MLTITPLLKNKLKRKQKKIKNTILLFSLIRKNEKVTVVIIKYKINEKKNA